jgi:Flp pilus assembly protein TadG
MTGPKARVRRDMGRGGRFVGARLMRALWHDRDGSALLEGALVMPLLIALMLGVYEFSWYFYQQHLIAVGVRDAARYLARSSDACDATSSQWASEAAYAQNLATTGFATGGPGRVKGWTSEMIAIECTPIDNRPGVNGLRPYRGDSVIYVVTVSTRFTDLSLGFFGLFGLRPPIISASHAERVIGPG